MEIIDRHDRLADPELVGNKTATLAKLGQAGFNVPPFFAIASQTLEARIDEVHAQNSIAAACDRICRPADQLAVRSSSTEEDGSERSFAGQFETFLRISRGDVLDYARRVSHSGDSDHLREYRRSTGQRASGRGPAVLVQRMVDADFAGVAFAAEPVSGNPDRAVVAATRGTGDALVSGSTQGDTWSVDRAGLIVERELEGRHGLLDDPTIADIARLAREVSEYIGRPQDIEWAARDGVLYLLQSRDITTMPAHRNRQVTALWDNSNIVESYGGVTLPLTFSVARSAYQEAYRQLGRALGIREKQIAANHRAYEQMIGLIQGRVYYNLLSWYRLLSLTPGFRYNKDFMEQMMGVTEGLPQDAMPRPAEAGRFPRVRSAVDLARVGGRLVARLMFHNRAVRRFHRDLDRFLAPVDLAAMSVDELLEYYEALQADVIPAWDTPLVNDLYCMMFHGALRKLSERWLPQDMVDIHNELVAGEAAIISLEPIRLMQRMAGIARSRPAFAAMLRNAPVARIEAEICDYPEFAVEYDDYLARFGDRCLDELKLESATLRDDPTILFRGIGQMATAGSPAPANDNRRRAAEHAVRAALSDGLLRRLIFRLILRLSRARVRDRENLRFERTRVYGRVRSVFVEIGRRLETAGELDSYDDIFFLDVAEITAFVRGTGVVADLATLVRARRREFADYAAGDDPPRRFITEGPPQRASSIRLLPGTDGEAGDTRSGQACSQGVVRGPVRIVTDPRDTDFREGEILVAQRTDPGWVTIFPLVRGMIMERGSLLSHSAIVARELAIPAVVGVENACRWLQDGDWVELDGGSGIIRKLETTDRAA